MKVDVAKNCFKIVFFLTFNLFGTYQRFFSRAAGIFGVGRRPTLLRLWAESTSGEAAGHYKDLAETGNRARKVSGTQGRVAPGCVTHVSEA